MSDRLRWFVGRELSLASLAYAARMKRLGHRYMTTALAALYSSTDDVEVLYGDPILQPKRLHGASGSW